MYVTPYQYVDLSSSLILPDGFSRAQPPIIFKKLLTTDDAITIFRAMNVVGFV